MTTPRSDHVELNERTLPAAVAELSRMSPIIRGVVSAYGNPPAWRREPGFASLVYTILEQQVSLASARAVYERLLAASGSLTPASFLALDESMLRTIGFSRQKTQYCRDLAARISDDDLDLDSLASEDDEAVRGTLTAVRGIGPWTADIYLLHSLGRPDVWPIGDLALRVAVREELGLSENPTAAELDTVGDQFRPWRSVAARVFWHGYLSRRGVATVT